MVGGLKKRVLLVQYSQSGQLTDVMRRFCAPLAAAEDVELCVETLRPQVAYPFPWPILRFFDTFPETVYADAPALEPLSAAAQGPFDLVILSYQAWFLSPSLPITAFLKSEAGQALLKGAPVVTVVACRDMWLMAQEEVKRHLAAAGADLVGHVALVDEAGTIGSFLATPVWVMTGKKGPHLGGLIPRAGVKPEQIEACDRFGRRILERLRSGDALDSSLLGGLGAVRINEALIFSENAGRRGFKVWGKLLRALGPQGSWQRKPVLIFYMAWLVLAILVLVPLGMLLQKVLRPFRGEALARQKAYYSAPSGA